MSKHALLQIMLRITHEVINLIKHEEINLTSGSILVSGYESLNPKKIDVVVQNLPIADLFYASPEVLAGDLFRE